MKPANHGTFLACVFAGVAYIGAAWLVLRLLGVSDSEMGEKLDWERIKKQEQERCR